MRVKRTALAILGIDAVWSKDCNVSLSGIVMPSKDVLG